jgi:hypothetical protein
MNQHSQFIASTILALLLLLAACSCSHRRETPLRYPRVDSVGKSELWEATSFYPQLDPAYFAEIDADELIHEVTGLVAYARYSEGWFGGMSSHFAYFGERFEILGETVYARHSVHEWGTRIKLTTEQVRLIDEAMADLRSALIEGINSGRWSAELRKQIVPSETWALVQLRVALNDPNQGVPSDEPRWRTEGVLPLCINYHNAPHMRWGTPPTPRLFIPSSRTTAMVFEIDAKHVPTILDCYKRIVLEVEGEN